MWRKIRITILLLILATAVQQTWLEKSALDWESNFYVAVYPVNADGSAKVSEYLRTLRRNDFEPIAEYFAEEAEQYLRDEAATPALLELRLRVLAFERAEIERILAA